MPRITKRTTRQTLIRRMVQRIVKKFQPEQVILFGSHARGDAGRDSDVDLLIVMDFEGTAFEKGLEITHVPDHGLTPVDVIVTRPEDFAWRKEVIGTIEWPVAQEGKVLIRKNVSR